MAAKNILVGLLCFAGDWAAAYARRLTRPIIVMVACFGELRSNEPT